LHPTGKIKQFTDDTTVSDGSSEVYDDYSHYNDTDDYLQAVTDDKSYFEATDDAYNYSQIVSQQSSVSNSSSSKSYWFSFTVSKRTWTRKPTPAPTPSPTQSIAEGADPEEEVDETTNAPTPSSATTQTSSSSAKAWWYWNRSPKNSNSSSYQDYNNTNYQDGKSWKRYWNRGNGTSYQEYNSSKYQATWKKYWKRGNNGTSYQEANGASYQASRGGNRMLKDAFIPELELYQRQFWHGVQRELESSSSKQVTWNFCERLYNYSFYCDVTCQNRVNAYYKDSWTKADVSVLSFCVILISVITCLIFIKRVKSYERFMLCHCGDDGDTDVDAGLPPIAIALLFVFIMGIIMILANLNLVNQTLVLALFTCVALVIIFVRMTVFCGKSSSHQRSKSKDIMGDYDDVRKRIFDAGI
jgi:hypothetical protein